MATLTPTQRQWLNRVLATLAALTIGVLAYRAYGWPGLGLAASALVMWGLLHMSRMLTVLRRTAQNPIGSVASAVMLHSRLVAGMPLLQVLALTRALGQAVGKPDGDPMEYVWTDASQASVRCSFAHGKLVRWELTRP